LAGAGTWWVAVDESFGVVIGSGGGGGVGVGVGVVGVGIGAVVGACGGIEA